MVIKLLFIIMATFAVIFSGCGKKPRQIPSMTGTPSLAKKTIADTGDIFNEFYRDSIESPNKNKKITQTFSVADVNPSAPATPKTSPVPAQPAKKSAAVTPEPPGLQFSKEGPYTVQIAVMDSRAPANKLAAAFKEKSYPAYVTEVENPTSEMQGLFYRVRLGGFATRDEAKTFGENVLKPANYDYWIDLKSNEEAGVSQRNQSSTPRQTASPATIQQTQSPHPAPSPDATVTQTPVSTPTGSAQRPASTEVTSVQTRAKPSAGQSKTPKGPWTDSSANW